MVLHGGYIRAVEVRILCWMKCIVNAGRFKYAMVKACKTVEAYVELGPSKCFKCAFSEMHGLVESLDVQNFID